MLARYSVANPSGRGVQFTHLNMLKMNDHQEIWRGFSSTWVIAGEKKLK